MAKKKNNILASFADGLKKVLNEQEQSNTKQQSTVEQTTQLPTQRIRTAWQQTQQAQQQRATVANNILNKNNSMRTASTAEILQNRNNLPTKENVQANLMGNAIQRAVDIRNSVPEEERKKEEEQIRKQEQLKQQQNNNNNDYQVGGTFKNVVNQASKEEQKETKTGEKIEKKENNLPTNINSKIFNAQNLQEAENDVEKRFLNTMENVTNATENLLLGGAKGLKDAADFTIHLANYPYDKARQLGLNIGSKITGKTFEDDGDYSQIGIMKKTIPEDSFVRPLVNKLSETKDSITGKINEKSKDIDTYIDTNIAQNIEESNDPIGKKITEIAPSIGQQLPAVAMGPVAGPEYFFFSSGGSYYKDALSRGMNKDQATVFGTIMGEVEKYTEGIQFGKVFKTTANLKAGGAIKQALKEYGLNIADNFVQEAITEPITELTALTIGGEDAVQWEGLKEKNPQVMLKAMIKRMWNAGVDGAFSSMIMDAGFAGVSSANRLIDKMENNEKISKDELAETLKDIQASGKVDINKTLQESFNQVTEPLRNALYSKGIDTTSALDKARAIDGTYNTNLTSEIQKALNEGKLNKNTYSELNKQLDQITQLKNSEDLLNHAKELDDTLELKDTEHSLTNVVEKLTNEAKLDNETYGKLKDVFTNIDNNIPYVTETSDNKKIDTFRDDMTKFMNNSVQSHNFAKSVESIIEKTGLNIRLNHQLADNENGRIFNENGETTIEINPNSQSAGEFVLMHELTHAIGNQDLKQTILDYAKKNTEFEAALKDLEARYGQNDVTEEVMADISGQLLGNEEFINSLAQEQPSKFKQIYNAVKSWVKKFTGTYGYEDFVRDVETKWRKAYEQNKNSITENIDQKILNNKTPLEEIPLFSKNSNANQNNIDAATKLENYEKSKKDVYKQLAEEFGESSTYWEANLDRQSKESIINTLKNSSSVQDKFIETHDFEKVYKPVEYTRFGTKEMQDFIKDNNIKSLKDLVNNEKLVNEYFDLWFGKKDTLNDYTKETYNTWKELFESQKELYNLHNRQDTLRPLKSFERDIEKINKNLTEEVDNFETSKKLKNMPEFTEYIEKYADLLNKEKPKITSEELTELAQNEFGTTDDFNTGAWMTPDGKLLDFNYGGYRDDHRAINSIGYTLDEFLEAGNIRMQPEGNGFELSQEPTAQQYKTLEKYIDSLNGEVFVDVGKDGINYNAGTPTSKIISDLHYYFENGKFPAKSSISDFLYSKGPAKVTDNQGRTLSQQTQDYFKDSEARNENGNLVLVFHGTNKAGFTIFNRNINFFTDNIDVAKSYTGNDGIYTGYVNITKPITIDANNEIWSKIDINNIKVDGIEDIQDFLNKYGASTWKEDGAIRTSVADLTAALYDMIEDESIDADGIIIKNVYDEGMYGDGKSGKHLGTDYITFNSNQFKNIDNTNPTNNPDIRYSKQSDKWQQFLDKNFPSRGTTNQLSDMKQILPTKELTNNNKPRRDC